MTDSRAPTDQPNGLSQRQTLMQERRSALVEEKPSAPSLKPSDQPPVVPRELIVLLITVVISDLMIYRSGGYAGPGVFLMVIQPLLLLGIIPRRFDRSSWVLAPLLVLISVRLVWCGSPEAVVAGFILLCGYAMGLAGLRPHVLQAGVFVMHLVAAGHRGLDLYSKKLPRFSPKFPNVNVAAVLLPIATLIVFGTIFVLANPDLVKSLHGVLTQLVEALQNWLVNFHPTEVLFCLGVAWITVGLLRPGVQRIAVTKEAVYVSVDQAKAPLYEAFRNTLIVVIGLFAVYLVFEFQTLWFRVFPKGFHYSGYAHEGAAWLTVALGLATLLLSLIFRGKISDEPRLARLRLLSWIWSIENLVLAAAVFNRLFIYVGFNGMTRMRVIGFLGVASVVGGFLLVLRKIAKNHDFVWLIRRQLWTVSFAGYLYAVLPVDAFVNKYNVRRILAGDPAPSVQISAHPTSAEGYLQLAPLIHCEDEIIRRGIRAMLSQQLAYAEDAASRRRELGWTAYQLAEDRLLEQLRATSPQWQNDPDRNTRQESLGEFYRYTYQWY